MTLISKSKVYQKKIRYEKFVSPLNYECAKLCSTGLPNATLVSERSRLAAFYKNRSVAEQNSVDIAWDIFMDSCFDRLRHTICSSEAELQRFRQLVVNSVMATDIMDKELKKLRDGRWEKAFKLDGKSFYEDATVATNRKATIVIEHLIQASDVAHTMQHWHIYRKWNEVSDQS